MLLIEFLKPYEGELEVIVHTSNSIKNSKVLRRYVKSRIRENHCLEDYKIIVANDTRWNSKYYLLKNIVKHKNIVDEVIEYDITNGNTYNLSLIPPLLWEFYEHVVDFLEVFEEPTVFLEADEYPTIGYSISTYNVLYQ